MKVWKLGNEYVHEQFSYWFEDSEGYEVIDIPRLTADEFEFHINRRLGELGQLVKAVLGRKEVELGYTGNGLLITNLTPDTDLESILRAVSGYANNLITEYCFRKYGDFKDLDKKEKLDVLRYFVK